MRRLFFACFFITAAAGISAQYVYTLNFYPETSNQERWKLVLNVLRHPDKAIADSLLNLALKELENGIDPEGCLMQGSALVNSGGLELRLAELDKAAALFKQQNDSLCYAYADYLFAKGLILGRGGKHDQKIALSRRAAEVLQSVDAQHEALLVYYEHLQNTEMGIRQISQGFNSFDKVLSLAEKKKNYYYLSQAYLTAGDLLKFYDPPVSELFYDYTQYIVSGYTVREFEEDPRYYLGLGTGKTANNKHAQALVFYHKGLEQLNSKVKTEDDSFYRKLFYYYIGVSHKNRGQTDEALAYLDTALIYDTPGQQFYYRTLQMQAEALNNAGRYSEALPLLKDIVDFYIKNVGTSNVLYTQTAIQQFAKAQQYLGHYGEALDWAHKNICYFLGSSDTLDVYKVPEVSHLISPEKSYRELEFSIYRKTEILMDMFKASHDSTLLTFIMKHFEFLMETTDVNASATQTHKALLSISDRYKYNSNKLLDFLSQADLPQTYQEEVYRLIAKSKAFSMLVKTIGNANAANMFDNAEMEENRQRRKKLHERLDFVTPSDTAEYMLLMAELLNLEKTEFLIRYYNPVKDEKLIVPNLISTRAMDVHSGIRDNESIIDYYVTKTALHAFVITPASFDFYSRPLPETFNKDMEGFFGAVKINDTKKLNALSLQLSELLLKDLPLETGKNLVIIPDEKLFVVPFDLLPLGGKLLVESNPVAYRYSSHLFRSNKRETTDYSLTAFAPVFDRETLAYAPDALRGFDEEDDTEDVLRDGSAFIAIPASSLEVAAIGELFADKGLQYDVYLRENSTKSNVLQFIEKSGILHIATHGFSNKNNPGMSGLAFASEEDGGGLESGYLSLTEISNLKLSSDLVVLSACKSGYGSITRGEGIMGLSRGFIAAGACNVMASLWKVHDEKTKDLMLAFYKYLLEDKINYAEALQKAKQDCIAKDYLPMDWAGFVLIGN